MKNRAKILFLLAIGMVAGLALYGQCTPDPTCVDDDEKPGQFCPLELPNGVVNILYDETVTVIPPGIYPVEGYGDVTILYIKIDTVENIPTGIHYTSNADILYPGTAYCIQLNGTPTEAGKDTLDIYITAMVDVLGGIEVPVVDDTSIVITIQETVGIAPEEETGFRVFQNVPNPFSELTRLDYYIPFDDRIELNVYNVLGVLVHQESEVVPPGEHSFRFDGKGLQPGTYFYRVESSEISISGKLVKSR